MKQRVINKQPCLTKYEENMKKLREAARAFDEDMRIHKYKLGYGGAEHSTAIAMRRAVRRCFKF